MRALLLCLSLSGCVALPDDARFHFICEESRLFVIMDFRESLPEDGYAAEVGHCIGTLQIIGPKRGTGV